MRLTQRATAWSLALACLLAPSLAAGQAIEILGSKVPLQAIGFGPLGGAITPVTSANPLPMICISGCSATGAGTATAAAPTRTEGQSYGLSFDLSGALRTTGGGGGGGGGTEFAEDAAHASGALGTFALVVRRDTAASLAGSDGDYSGLIVDALGRLHVNPGTVPVTGTFWQATQPVSLASQPLPAGAATSALQTPANASLAAIDADLGSSADPAYSGTGASAMAYLRAVADAAISTGPAQTQLTPSTAYFNVATGSTKYLVATGSQVLTDYFIENPDASAKAYLQLFNASAIANVTLGTTVPVRSIGLAAGEKANLSGLALSFPLGLVIAGTATVTGSTGATTPLVVNLGYRGN